MNLIKSYENFLDFLLEEYIKLDAPLYYSQPLKDTLASLASKGNKVAKFLCYAEQSDDNQSDITFVDLGNGNDKVNFIQVNRVLRMIDKDLGDPESKNQGQLKGQLPQDYLDRMWRFKNNPGSAVWSSQQRTELQVGRFATKIIQKSKDTNAKSLTQNDINAFVDNFKAYRDFQTTKKERFEVVSGEDIRKWYWEGRYEDASYHLLNSCMRYGRCQDYLNIYVENPNQVTMVIMKGIEPNKIIGRALIWKLNNGEIYLDRPYANNDEDVNLFKQWGRDNEYQVYGDGYKGKEVTLDKSEFSSYPYMDTFKYLNRDVNLLSTNANQFDDGDQNWIRLESTGGGYEEAQTGIWSDYEGEYIDEEDAVFCQDIQDYTYSDNSYYLEYLDQYYSSRAGVVYSEYSGNYYLEEDAIHSDYLGDWIYSQEAIEVYFNSDDQTWVPDNFMTRGLADEYFIENKNKICLSACVFKSPFADEYLFRFGTLLVYKLEDGSMVTELEAEEKEIDVEPLGDSFYVDLDDYIAKVEKINEEELRKKLIETDVVSFIPRFKELVERRTGFRNDIRRFFSQNTTEVFEGMIKLLIFFSYKASEKNDFGKPRRKNRKEMIVQNEFVDMSIIDDISVSSIELMFEVVDAQISDIIKDKNFLSQIILLKSIT